MNVSIERFLAPLCDTLISDTIALKYYYKMVDYLKKALIYGHTSRILS